MTLACRDNLSPRTNYSMMNIYISVYINRDEAISMCNNYLIRRLCPLLSLWRHISGNKMRQNLYIHFHT